MSSKTSWRRLANTSWRRLEDVLGRRIANTSWRRLEDVLEDEKCYVEDAFKTSWRRLGKQEMFAGEVMIWNCFSIPDRTTSFLITMTYTQFYGTHIHWNIYTRIHKARDVIMTCETICHVMSMCKVFKDAIYLVKEKKICYFFITTWCLLIHIGIA